MKIDEQGFFSGDEEAYIQYNQVRTIFIEKKIKETQRKQVVKIVKPLSIYLNTHLYKYPSQLDKISKYEANEEDDENDKGHNLQTVKAIGEEKEDICGEFMSRVSIVFLRFKTNFQKKKDPTLYIQSVSNLVRNQMLTSFEQIFPSKSHNEGLLFCGNYEGSNLHTVFRDKKQNNYYYLLLQSDTNTCGFNQWFNFYVKAGTNCHHSYKFIILNISKGIRYDPQMRMLEYSDGKWKRKRKFGYYQSRYSKNSGDNFMTVEFDYQTDEKIKKSGVFFCLSFPYTFTKLCFFMRKVQQKGGKVQILGKTSLKNPIYIFKSIQEPKQKNTKECIIVLGRQHPCETVGSFICQEIISRLLKNKNQSHYNWYVIPMVNVDGVVHGNSRTNIKGYDINRCWDKQNLQLCEQSYILNQQIQRINKKERIKYIFDFHGHSKQLDSFSYSPQQNMYTDAFNTKMSQKCEYYNKKKCKYGLSYDKKQTLRGQMQYRLKIKSTITIQTSYYGYQKNNILIPFQEKHFKSLASSFLDTVQQIYEIQNDPQKMRKLQEEYVTPSKIQRKLKKEVEKEIRNSDEDSDSDPEGDYLKEKERKDLQRRFMKSDSVKDKKFEKRKSNLLSAKVIIFKNDKSHDKSVVIPKKIEQKRKESGKISLIELKHEAQNKLNKEDFLRNLRHKTQTNVQGKEKQFIKRNTSVKTTHPKDYKDERFFQRKMIKNKFNNVLLRAQRKQLVKQEEIKCLFLEKPFVYPVKNDISYDDKKVTMGLFKKKKVEEQSIKRKFNKSRGSNMNNKSLENTILCITKIKQGFK